MNKYSLVLLALLCLSSTALGLPADVIKETVAPGKTCTGLAFDGKLIWVADHGLDELMAVDPASGRVKMRLKSPAYRPAGLAFDGTHLWNVDTQTAKIYRINPANGVVSRTIPAPVSEPRALAFDGQALWLSDDDGRTIHRVDPSDGTTITETPFPSKSVDGLAHDGHYLWVSDRLADRLYAVHPPTGEVVVSLKSPGPHPTGLGWNGKQLLNVDYQTDKIYSLRRDDSQFAIKQDPRDAWVVFTHQVRNFGPDKLADLEVFLALPKDLDSQRLLSAPQFEPKPAEIVTDRWGQKSARFLFKELKSGQTANVRMKVHLKAQTVHYVVYPEKVQNLWKIPTEIRRSYLVDAPKYDIKNPIIVKAVKKAVQKEKNPYWIARKIYRYVHDHMYYKRIGGWDVAPKLLQRGSGSCSEYSYVFIAMCRAAGLPARYVGALVVRKDAASFDDVFHRWVEVYLPPYGWIPVDPSRGDKSSEAQRADSFGHLYRDFLITTHGGGDSEHLGWSYNHNERYACTGRCNVDVETIAEWSPEDPK
jgi:transglutaminase-like putative cysteine protease